MDSLYIFPDAPTPGLTEWPGSPVGASNTITRTKGRTAVHNKSVDATPGLLDKLLASAQGHLNDIQGKEPILQRDVMIHGVRVRATTNSQHLFDFWTDNWYGLDEWQKATGQAPPTEPRVNVYALHGVKAEPEAAYYSHDSNTIAFFNTSYYGQLKSWVLGAVGRILAAEYGIHSIHGACVEKDGKGVLYIAPTGTGKSTSSYGLMEYPKTRFHSDDWVYVRYTYRTRDGRRVFILRAEGTDGTRAKGYQVYRWIERHRNDSGARLTAMSFDNREIALTLGDLDLASPLEAYAYTSEKVFYLRTNLAENFPLSAFQILASKEENVPDVTAAFLDHHRTTLTNVLRDLRAARDGEMARDLHRRSDSELAEICARLIAFDNARSMLDITKVLPSDRVYANPMEPVRLAAVILLKRNADDPTVLEHLSLDHFMERLLIGETPDKKRETAYNAYRAVDDKAERACIENLEKHAGPGRSLYQLFSNGFEKPASLEEEFELFRVMYQASRCYDLNTTMQKDPGVRDKRQAVARTMSVIARTLDETPQGIRLSIENYARYID
ncbi:MAG: hypothetical protein ACE145_19845 [Terriglobia bacterium]